MQFNKYLTTASAICKEYWNVTYLNKCSFIYFVSLAGNSKKVFHKIRERCRESCRKIQLSAKYDVNMCVRFVQCVCFVWNFSTTLADVNVYGIGGGNIEQSKCQCLLLLSFYSVFAFHLVTLEF